MTKYEHASIQAISDYQPDLLHELQTSHPKQVWLVGIGVFTEGICTNLLETPLNMDNPNGFQG